MPEQDELTTLTFCLTMERCDGAGLAVTSHDRAFQVDQALFEPSPLFTPGAVTRSAKLDSNATEIEGALESSALRSTDLSSGRWDGARTCLTSVSWHDSTGEVVLARGQLASTLVSERGFSAELTGAASELDAKPFPTTSPECRAVLGSKQCRVDLAGRRRRARVIEAQGEIIRLDSQFGEDFLFGEVRWVSGANTGLRNTILRVEDGCVYLRERPRLLVEPGDRLVATQGCDKRLQTCAGRFKNVINFRGEPHLPGNDFLTRYPGE